MSDYSKSSPRTRSRPTQSTTGRPLEAPSRVGEPPSSPAVTGSTDAYSIRLISPPGVLCARCGTETGTGPVGHQHDQPICDLCLLAHCQHLGLVLALVCVTRAFAAVETDDRDEVRAALRELGGFARIYDRVAAVVGPRRILGVRPDDLAP